MNTERIERLLLIAEMAQNETLTPSLVEYATIDACEAGVDALRTVQAMNNPRQYALKTGKCPMCEDCPDGCPITGEKQRPLTYEPKEGR